MSTGFLSNLIYDSDFFGNLLKRFNNCARHWQLTPVILATQKTEIRRITVQNQPGKIVCETLSRKYPSQKRAGRMAQGVGPEFKPQYQNKQKKDSTATLLGNIVHD
jgi:hypothetical protein